MERFDAAVIGGGLLGCFAARELSRRKLDIILLEAREDVCTGISRANTAVVYSGYDHKPGTLKAEMTVRANASFDRLCRDLDVPFSRCGSLMLSFGPGADAVLRKKLQNGEANGVPGLRLLDAESAYAMEPGLAPGLRHALFSPTTGTVNPWQLGIAACENAVHNGAQLRLNTKVIAIHHDQDGYLLETDRGSIRTCAVINCAGLNADRIQALAFPTEVRIVPTAGDYLVLDKNSVGKPTHILEYEPEEKAKGLTVVPTVEGSLLLGPSERDNTLDYATTADGLLWVREQAARLLPGLDHDGTIRSFAAVRPNPEQADGRSIHSFCIEHPAERFWSLIGIKTPGLTCARELGQYVAAALARELRAEENPAFDPLRHAIPKAHTLSFDERQKLAAAEPDYGEIVCCCEDVTRGEILEAIRRGACTVDGVKRRVGTGMGCCQGARCQQKIAALISEALRIPESAVTKDGMGTERVYHGAC